MINIPVSIVVHHSATGLDATAAVIHRMHIEKGWRDVGYHKIIEADGQVRAGRQWPENGAHCLGHNESTYGICVIGNNTEVGSRWEISQILALEMEIERVKLTYLPASVLVFGHNEMKGAKTLCPGVDVRGLLGISGTTTP